MAQARFLEDQPARNLFFHQEEDLEVIEGWWSSTIATVESEVKKIGKELNDEIGATPQKLNGTEAAQKFSKTWKKVSTMISEAEVGKGMD